MATKDHGAIVLTGNNRNGLLFNSSSSANFQRSAYTSHLFGDGNIIIRLGQPYNIGSIRLLLDEQNQSNRFTIQTSLDNQNWTMAVDRRDHDIQSSTAESICKFNERLVLYVKIVGTNCSNLTDGVRI